MTPAHDPNRKSHRCEPEDEILPTQRIPRSHAMEQAAQVILQELQDWYRSLSLSGKLMAAMAGLLLTSVALNATLRLLLVTIQLTLTSAILYGTYRWITRSPK